MNDVRGEGLIPPSMSAEKLLSFTVMYTASIPELVIHLLFPDLGLGSCASHEHIRLVAMAAAAVWSGHLSQHIKLSTITFC